MASPTRPLVHRRLDGWLLGGLGVAAWFAVGPVGVGGSTAPIGGVLAGAFLTTSAMHFGASYHLAYGDGVRALRRHPWALVAAPLALVGAVSTVVALEAGGHSAVASEVLRVLLVAVFTLTGWHYVKQAYGVGMLSARSHGLRPDARQIALLRYGLYPVWIYDVLEIYQRDRPASYGGFDVSVGIVPGVLASWFRAVAVVSLIMVGVVMVQMALRARRRPPMGLWAAYLAGGLWFVAPPSYLSAAVVLGGIHSVQYLACAHRAEVDLAVERGEPHLLHRWLCIFGGAAAGGLLLTNWLPDSLDAVGVGRGLPGMAAALVFVVFNLHHYAVDAAIWRSGGDHVTRISKGPRPAETTPSTEPVTIEPATPALA